MVKFFKKTLKESKKYFLYSLFISLVVSLLVLNDSNVKRLQDNYYFALSTFLYLNTVAFLFFFIGKFFTNICKKIARNKFFLNLQLSLNKSWTSNKKEEDKKSNIDLNHFFGQIFWFVIFPIIALGLLVYILYSGGWLAIIAILLIILILK